MKRILSSLKGTSFGHNKIASGIRLAGYLHLAASHTTKGKLWARCTIFYKIILSLYQTSMNKW
ncbi:hypothetical protein RSC2_03678 [Bacillus paralicheniformis]|nr:hypothetical protein RSC1_01823 [Bacillus paralicheniformis]BCE11882.1 hypothetical protein RSC2_03678 [Bacillus paralicheniformis]BCE13495.1 hypothetical protein RSC3_00851 [Bacillus paralicheniformis]